MSRDVYAFCNQFCRSPSKTMLSMVNLLCGCMLLQPQEAEALIQQAKELWAFFFLILISQSAVAVMILGS